MDKQNEQKNGKVEKRQGWLAAVTGLLFVAICVTVALLASILKWHASSDEDAIALVPSKVQSVEASESTESESEATETIEQTESMETTIANEDVLKYETDSKVTAAADTTQQSTIGWEEEEITIQKNPDIQVYDDIKTWETATEVDIFKIAYENGEAVVTVDGMDDKVIAPGTGNEYTFYLKNTGDVLLDYTLEIEAYFTPDTHPIPVEARLKGYDGTYLLGADDSWSDVLELNQVKDEASISVNRYAYYTLEWRWPFESGDDAYDTLLGNMAVDEDLTLTIVIKTVATGEDMATEIHTKPVGSGDNTNLLGWIGLAATAMPAVVFIIICKKRLIKSDESEQEQVNEKD